MNILKNKELEFLIEDSIELAAKPLYNELEVGFRHSPLTNNEKLERYALTCYMLQQNLILIQRMLNAESAT